MSTNIIPPPIPTIIPIITAGIPPQITHAIPLKLLQQHHSIQVEREVRVKQERESVIGD